MVNNIEFARKFTDIVNEQRKSDLPDAYELKGFKMKKIVMNLIIPGKPIAKNRPRFARRGKFVVTYSDQETEEGRFLFEVYRQIGEYKPIYGAVRAVFKFFFARPKNHYGTGRNAGKLKESAPKYHITKPDFDNLDKFAADCLKGIAWIDDCQVVSAHTTKDYIWESEEPRTEIEITEVTE